MFPLLANIVGQRIVRVNGHWRSRWWCRVLIDRRTRRVVRQMTRGGHPSPAGRIITWIGRKRWLCWKMGSGCIVGRIRKSFADHPDKGRRPIRTFHAAPAPVVAVLKHILVLAVCKVISMQRLTWYKFPHPPRGASLLFYLGFLRQLITLIINIII